MKAKTSDALACVAVLVVVALLVVGVAAIKAAYYVAILRWAQ